LLLLLLLLLQPPDHSTVRNLHVRL